MSQLLKNVLKDNLKERLNLKYKKNLEEIDFLHDDIYYYGNDIYYGDIDIIEDENIEIKKILDDING